MAIISATDGQLYRGVVTSVGVDHVSLRDGPLERLVALGQIVGIEFR
ncbi:MAG: hypothetical protein ACE5KX_07550 [Acidimicrobiia bacterium]